MFLPGLLPHPDVVGVGVAGRGARRHGAVTGRVIGYRAGIGQVSWRGAGHCTCLDQRLYILEQMLKSDQVQCVF